MNKINCKWVLATSLRMRVYGNTTRDKVKWV